MVCTQVDRLLTVCAILLAGAAGWAQGVPSAYKITFPPGGNAQLIGTTKTNTLPAKINNRGEVLYWHAAEGPLHGTSVFRRYAGNVGFLTLPGLEADKVDNVQADAEPGEICDVELANYFTWPIQAVGTSLKTAEGQGVVERSAMGWSVNGQNMGRTDLGALSGKIDSIALGGSRAQAAVGFAESSSGTDAQGFYTENFSTPTTMTALTTTLSQAMAINDSGVIVGRDASIACFWPSSTSQRQLIAGLNPQLTSRFAALTSTAFGTWPRAVGYYYTPGTPGQAYTDALGAGFVANLQSGTYFKSFSPMCPSSINDSGVVVFLRNASIADENHIWFPDSLAEYVDGNLYAVGATIPFVDLPNAEQYRVSTIVDINLNNQIVGQLATGTGSATSYSGFIGTALYNVEEDDSYITIPVAFEGIANLDNEDYETDHPVSIAYRVFQGQVLVKPNFAQTSADWVEATTIERVVEGGTVRLYLRIPNKTQGLRGLVTILMQPRLSGGTQKARHLTKVVLVNVPGRNATASTATFLTGDIDRDDAVTVYDYNLLSAYFDKTSEDSDWNTVGTNGVAPRECDLDEDGAISVYDYSLLSQNFDRTGDTY